MEIFNFILLIIFGLGFGSFATMAVYRLPNNIPWISQKPFCPKCKHDLYFRDYFSIISYFINKGKCRFCNEKIEFHLIYLLTEIFILTYFIINFLLNNFSDLFIINSAIILAITIWSLIYANSQKSFDHILQLSLFFISIKQIYLGASITDLIFNLTISICFILANWHLYFLFKKQFKNSLSYLQYSTKNRFLDDKYIIIKIAILIFFSIPLNLYYLLCIYLSLICLNLFVKKTHLILAVFANFIILANLL